MNSQTQATLLERLRDGANPLAWDEFFERYWRMIYALARYRGCSDHTAEEIVQDVMLAVFEKRDVFRYDPARGRFRDWLGSLVRNKVAEHRRRPAERVRAQGGASEDGFTETRAAERRPDETWEAACEEALLAVLLDVVRREMNPRTYQAFELLALDELPGAEVARITGTTRNAVYLARRKVLKRLKELGGSYRDDGQLHRLVKQALRAQPSAAVERSLTSQIDKTIRSKRTRGQSPFPAVDTGVVER